MIPTIIALAITSGLSTLLFRIIISRPPFRVKKIWSQIFISMGLGAILWGLSIVLINPALSSNEKWADIFCGILILLCAFWCNYWIGNFAGGFRVQMQMNIADQMQPITFEGWMKTFGGLGMETFLKDRIQSILIPWKTIAIENNQLRLLPGWGTFFGKAMDILKRVFPTVRRD